jgi:hypothetical protein
VSGAHESPRMGKDEWLTPPWLIARLGTFDLDPCSPGNRRPWDTAKRHIDRHENGLTQPWHGRVWLNPPYGKFAALWLKRLAAHRDGIALIFARTDTESFFESVWDAADAVLFLRGRMTFCHVTGKPGDMAAGAASVLVAYGPQNVKALEACADLGHFQPIRKRYYRPMSAQVEAA